ncbi:MAG: hypothetical protein AB7P20_01965 [Rhizobiaceae bacterium]
MFTLVSDNATLKKAARLLRLGLRVGSSRSMQTISSPGGKIDEAEVYHNPTLDLWGHVAKTLNDETSYYSGFGIGSPSWQPSIQINVPAVRTLHCNGQVVQNRRGELYLAHKGGLGGGKYSVRASDFADLIRGFEREVVGDGDTSIELFVLGRIEENQLPSRLSEFVHEAERIRRLRRNQAAFTRALKAVGGANSDDSYRPENDQDGSYEIKRRIEFKRIHGRVQRQLAAAIKRLGLSCGNRRLTGGISPDLLVKDRNDTVVVLFEIKVPPGSQSTFTAIGQLVVYGIDQPDVRRVLVSRSPPSNELMKSAFDRLNIEHLRFEIDDSNVRFFGLDKLLATYRTT